MNIRQKLSKNVENEIQDSVAVRKLRFDKEQGMFG
jgi:hypothetical protein